jgi:response regulator RpfG family c-di-GMP phosphodiesterase
MIEPKPLIVIVHEDEKVLAALEALLGTKEYLLITFTSKERSLNFIGRNGPDLVLVQRPAVPSDGITYLERIKGVSSSTEGIFLPSPLELREDGTLKPDQSRGIAGIVERLLTIRVIPEFRRTETRSFRVRPVEA